MTFPQLSLQGRVAVVLGGTTGIGRSLSLGLARAGAEVVASARRIDLVQEIADELVAIGGRTLRLTSDVTDRASLEQLRDAVVSTFGKVDILLNCAGKTKRGPTLDFSLADWESILDTNLTGTMRACQVFGRPMLDRGYGRIVNIASLTTSVAFHEVAAYGASKAGVGALTEVARGRVGPAWGMRPCHRPGRVPHRAVRGPPRRPRARAQSSSPAPRWRVSAASRSSREPRSSSRRRRRASSTGRS